MALAPIADELNGAAGIELSRDGEDGTVGDIARGFVDGASVASVGRVADEVDDLFSGHRASKFSIFGERKFDRGLGKRGTLIAFGNDLGIAKFFISDGALGRCDGAKLCEVDHFISPKLGRASGRERVSQSV